MSEHLLSWANVPDCPNCGHSSWIRDETVDAMERTYILDTSLIWRHIHSTGGMSDSSYHCDDCNENLDDQVSIAFLRALEKKKQRYAKK